MKANRMFLVIFCLMISYTPISCGNELSDETEQLAFCSGVLPYGINYALMSDNEGLAKVLSMQAARVNVALFATNQNGDGVIPGKRIAEFNILTKKVKPEFDKNPNRLAPAIDECSNLASKIIERESSLGTLLFDLPLNTVVIKMNQNMQEILGL